MQVVNRILSTWLLLHVLTLAFSQSGTKIVIAVSANDCIHCTLVLENILQNGSNFDSVFAFFDSKEHKKLLEKKFKNRSNIVFQHKNPLDSLLIKPGFSTVHVHSPSFYHRMFLKSVVTISQLTDPPLNKQPFSFHGLEVDQNSFLITSNGQTTILYNKYSNRLHYAWHHAAGNSDHINEIDHSMSLFDYQTAMALFNSDVKSNVKGSGNEISFESYLQIFDQFGMPPKNVHSIALVENYLFLYAQLNLLRKQEVGDEIEIHPYDFIYIYKSDMDNKLLELETVIPTFSSAVYKEEAAFLISSFSKHQVVNSTKLYSSAFSIFKGQLNPFDLNGVGILYNLETLLSKNNHLIALNTIETKEIDFEILGKANAKNSLLITDQNSFTFLYNRLLNKAFDLSIESNLDKAIEPKTMISQITGNRLDLDINKIFACEIYQGNLLLCVLNGNNMLKLIKYNLNSNELVKSDIELPGIMSYIGFNKSKLIYCGIDGDKELLSVHVFEF
jgi:hypothetical protein